HVQLKDAGPLEPVVAHIAVSTRRCRSKSRAVEPVVKRLFARVWIWIYQNRGLVCHRRQCLVRTRENTELAGGLDLEDRGDLPVARQNPQRPVGELRCGGHQVENELLPQIDSRTVAAV